MSSTLKNDETGEPFHVQQAQADPGVPRGVERGRACSASRACRSAAASSRSTTDQDRAYFGRDGESADQIGFIDADTRAIFGRTYAAEPDVLVEQLAEDEAIAAADTLLLTVPNQLGVDYNAHVIENILTHVAPALGWR